MKPKPITHILAATDFSVCADRALEYAAFLAEACSAPLDILHAVEIPPDMDSEEAAAGRFFEQRRKEAEEPMERLVRRLASAGAVATLRQRFGIPSQQINAAVFFDLELGLGAAPEYERARADAESRLADVHNALAQQGLAVRTTVSGGLLADSILADAQAGPCDVIVMGTHGRRGLPHLMTGSVAEAVLRRASCPVWTVRSLLLPRQDRLSPTTVALGLGAQ